MFFKGRWVITAAMLSLTVPHRAAALTSQPVAAATPSPINMTTAIPGSRFWPVTSTSADTAIPAPNPKPCEPDEYLVEYWNAAVERWTATQAEFANMMSSESDWLNRSRPGFWKRINDTYNSLRWLLWMGFINPEQGDTYGTRYGALRQLFEEQLAEADVLRSEMFFALDHALRSAKLAADAYQRCEPEAEAYADDASIANDAYYVRSQSMRAIELALTDTDEQFYKLQLELLTFKRPLP